MKPASLAALSAFACLFFANCSGNKINGDFASKNGNSRGATKAVRTTAYSHQESDSLQYGRKNAKGTQLKYGQVRSAAADWSIYPVGTTFQIEGEPYVYEIDDYGSALVGKNTIDLYKPDLRTMHNYGAKDVNIKILNWGSYSESLRILKDRQKANHTRRMYQSILVKTS
ncbi:MAG: 3D domain-containing protein [Verrucomicrobiales bacterium]